MAALGVSGWLASSATGEPRPASLRDSSATQHERLHLLALGDTGTNTPKQHQVAGAMNAVCARQSCNAVVMLGDNFYPHGVSSTTDPGWLDKFENVYDQPALDGVPFYAVLGNHDYGVGSFGSKAAQIEYSSLPVARCGDTACAGARVSGKWVLPSAYYEVDMGLVHLFALDTQLFVGTRQVEHMQRAVRRSRARWKIALGHHPLVTSGYHDDSGGLLGDLGMRHLLESVLCTGVDLYLAGHDHDLEYVAPGAVAKCPRLALAISGAGSSTRPAPDETVSPRVGQSEFFDDQHVGFLSIHATRAQLRLRFVGGSGEALFETTLLAEARDSDDRHARSHDAPDSEVGRRSPSR